MMFTPTKNKERPMQEDSTTDFHGAAIIDDEGREIPITEEMVREACETLEESKKNSSQHTSQLKTVT